MNALRLFVLGLSLNFLGACAVIGAGDRGRHATIASLAGKRAHIDADQHIEGGRDKAAATYREALRTAANPRMEAEALRRLADLELERAESDLLDREAPPSGSEFDDAMALYESLLASHPENDGNDRVLYQLARARENAARPEAALDALDRLVAGYPTSIYFDEAQFRRGELLFQARRYHQAETAYAEVIGKGSTSAFYAPALYKKGWSLFKQSMNEEALSSFFDLLDLKLVRDGEVLALETMSRAERELTDDSLRAISISLSYLSTPAETGTWLAGRKPPYGFMIYSSLADLYVSQERFADAARTAEAFVKDHPADKRSPGFQSRVIATWQAGKFPSRALEARAEFVELYAPGAPFWSVNDASAMPDVLETVRSHVTGLAQHHHALYQALEQAGDDREAARAEAATEAIAYYRRSLEFFPQDAQAGETSFLMAELLFETSRFEQATDAYEQAAYSYPAFDQRAEAGYAALLAYAEHEKALTDGQRAVWHARGLESGLRFADTFPGHPQANAVLVRSAEEMFAAGELDRAVALSSRVLESQAEADAPLRITALTVSGHANFELQRFGEAENAYSTVLTELPERDERNEALTEKLAAAIYKQAESMKAGGDLAGAAVTFQRVVSAAPASSIRSVAEYDAAAMLMSLEDWKSAASALQGFIAAHPGHELAADAKKSLVAAHQENQNPVAAAAVLETISHEAPNPDEQEAALWQASELYLQAGAGIEAARALESYVARFPERIEPSVEARQKLVELGMQAGDSAAVKRWRESIVSADRAAGDAGTPRTKTLASIAALELALPAVAAYREVALRVPLKKSLRKKKQRMEAALDGLAGAAEYGIADVATRATFEIAGVYRHMGSALMESERPRGLSEDELEQYEILLEEQAFPFEEQAIELHEANVARLSDGTFDEWIEASLSALGDLMPARYAKNELSEVSVAQIH